MRGRRRFIIVALAAAVVSTLVRVLLAHVCFGFQTGDDVEIAQEALRRAAGLRYEPWGLRSLFVSDVVVAPLLKLAGLFGVTSFGTLAAIARYPFILLSGLNVFLLYLLGRRWYDERAAALASVLFAAHWLPLVYGSSLYPRIVATTCVLLACLLLDRAAFGSGLLAAVAFATRFSEGVFFASLAILRSRVALFLGFGIGVLLFAGAYDWLTWGAPFSSLREFFDYTLVERQSSSRVKAQAPWFYLAMLPFWLAPTVWPFLAAAWRTSARRIVAMVLVPVLVLSAIHHKELRYLQVVLPFAMLFAAHGATLWWERYPSRRGLIVALLLLAIPIHLGRTGGVARRSMNAVRAAQWLSAQSPRSVALSQSWAYGTRIHLGNTVDIREVGTPPALDAEALSRDCVSLYRSELTAELDAALRAAGHAPRRTFAEGDARAVVVFCR
jgi:hypothetical protein